MKRPYVQRYSVRFADGRVEELCCGPAVCAAEGVAAFVSVGEQVDGVCCHRIEEPANVRVMRSIDERHLSEWLAANAWREGH